LHRLGIQGFEVLKTTSKCLKIHPLICFAFNADFDGDQMGIHLPISLKAQAEVKLIMFSVNNLSSPSTGDMITVPSQDMILGCYYLTIENSSLYYAFETLVWLFNSSYIFISILIYNSYGKMIKFFMSPQAAIYMYRNKKVSIYTYIWIGFNTINFLPLYLKPNQSDNLVYFVL